MNNDNFDDSRYFPDIYDDDGNLIYQCCRGCPFFENCDCDPYNNGCVLCKPDPGSEQCRSCKCFFSFSGSGVPEPEADKKADDGSDDDVDYDCPF